MSAPPPFARPTMSRRLIVGTVLLVATVGSARATEAGPVVLPEAVTLDGPRAEQRVLVHDRREDGFLGGPAADATLTVADPSVAVAEGMTVRAVADGTTTATVAVGETRLTVPVTVRGVATPAAVSFTNDVLPVLARAGCNGGACHGALAGKGGFKLSLRGYDPAGDHRRITAEAGGRRIELADPGRSLLIAKPSGAIPHKGGLKLDVGSDGYRTLATWIAEGARGPVGATTGRDAAIASVELFPKEIVVAKGEPVRVFVVATFADGRTEDVTDRTKFTSTDESVARIDEDGRVSVIGHGVGAITAWYSSRIAVARLVSPFEHDVPEAAYASAPPVNFIDELVTAQLKTLRLEPSPICDDATFLRRATLDTVGMLPTREEVEAFLADDRPDKRTRLIDDLLSREGFVDYWTYKWSDLLLISGNNLRPQAVKAYYDFVRREVAANTPWDEFVRKIVTARGESLTSGETNFYAVHQDPETMSENVAQAFLGLSIGCAKCHNHPLEKWTNDQYYAMANHFARVRGKGWGGDGRSGDGARTIYVADRGELIQPLTGQPQPPTPLDGDPIDFADPRDRREVLAGWLTDPDNELFSRAIVNRVWANYFGVGLVEPVDDLRASNPPRNEPLMRAASDYLVAEGFDLKRLMRAILTSHTYQRSSVPTEGNADDSAYFARYYPRRLMAEVLHDAFCTVTDVPSTFDQIAFPGADKQKTDFYPRGTRAIELYDAAVESYFLQSHGRNPRDISCECERSAVPSMTQVLHLCNGDTLLKKLSDKEGRAMRWIASNGPATDDAGAASAALDALIDDVYLRGLARHPSDDERTRLRTMLAETPAEERPAAVEDLFWSVMTSREFLFQH